MCNRSLPYSICLGTADIFRMTYCVLQVLFIFPTMKDLPKINQVEHFSLNIYAIIM